ncbi:hypothetical protein VP01_687g2 [Puccinia sorghi]|uniref:Uncharacterized protein n=1 Tax=Puccinia sorghi TaxID=27349 RepID=A0A0L6UF60_9BASI|nr:hypothetical protein VP01_687g2 [Puccinia sorghi]
MAHQQILEAASKPPQSSVPDKHPGPPPLAPQLPKLNASPVHSCLKVINRTTEGQSYNFGININQIIILKILVHLPHLLGCCSGNQCFHRVTSGYQWFCVHQDINHFVMFIKISQFSHILSCCRSQPSCKERYYTLQISTGVLQVEVIDLPAPFRKSLSISSSCTPLLVILPMPHPKKNLPFACNNDPQSTLEIKELAQVTSPASKASKTSKGPAHSAPIKRQESSMFPYAALTALINQLSSFITLGDVLLRSVNDVIVKLQEFRICNSCNAAPSPAQESGSSPTFSNYVMVNLLLSAAHGKKFNMQDKTQFSEASNEGVKNKTCAPCDTLIQIGWQFCRRFLSQPHIKIDVIC